MRAVCSALSSSPTWPALFWWTPIGGGAFRRERQGRKLPEKRVRWFRVQNPPTKVQTCLKSDSLKVVWHGVEVCIPVQTNASHQLSALGSWFPVGVGFLCFHWSQPGALRNLINPSKSQVAHSLLVSLCSWRSLWSSLGHPRQFLSRSWTLRAHKSLNVIFKT